MLKDLNEAISVWSISLFSSAELISFFCKDHIIVTQVLPNHHHCDRCFYFTFAPGLCLCTKCSLNTTDILLFIVNDAKLCMSVDLCEPRSNYFTTSTVSSIFISATGGKKNKNSKYLVHIKSLPPRGDKQPTVSQGSVRLADGAFIMT